MNALWRTKVNINLLLVQSCTYQSSRFSELGAVGECGAVLYLKKMNEPARLRKVGVVRLDFSDDKKGVHLFRWEGRGGREGARGRQSWALSVFLNFFSIIKNDLLAFFIKFITYFCTSPI